jgi:hypothetical protein
MKPIRHHLRNAFLPHEGNNFHPHLLRWPWVHALSAIVITVKVVAILGVSLYAGQAHQSSVTPSAITQLSNQARKAQGQAGLKTNSALTKAAQAKAKDMISNDYFAHISPKRVTPWYWFSQAGYRYTSAGENLAIDYVNSEDVIQAWLNSPSHRKNLLNSKYQDIGVAVATGEINGTTSVIVVQMFGTPTKSTSKVVTTAPKQVPNVATTKQQLAATHPVVLGQSTPTSTLPQPTISSPMADSVVHGAPTFVGLAEAGSTVVITEASKILESQTVPTNGVFSITLPPTLSDGRHVVTITSSARGQHTSTTLPIHIDQVAPQIDPEKSIILPSIIGLGAYDVMVTPSVDTTNVQVVISGQSSVLQKNDGTFFGVVSTRPSTTSTVNTRLTDLAGNTTELPLLDPKLFTSGVVAQHGPAYNALQMLFFSKSFLYLFILLMMIGMVVNVSMTWHRQHHPALLPTMLLVYLSGALLLL